MNIQIAYMGEIEIDPTKILTFEHGVPGFEDEKEFVLLEIEENSTFQILQSLKTENLAFIVTDPCFVTISYSIDLDEATIHSLQIKNEEDVAIYAIVSLKETIAKSTVNLQAPVIINRTNNKAKQVILNDDRYAIRHQISLVGVKG